MAIHNVYMYCSQRHKACLLLGLEDLELDVLTKTRLKEKKRRYRTKLGAL